ncbi:S24 family peptidase [Calidifontibacter terrae]
MRGRSMLPSLCEGDRLLVLYGARPRPGRLHLVALGGGRPLAVKRIHHPTADGWWVSSDNPDEGTDSRTVGAIPPAGMIGRVLGGRPLPRLPRRSAAE